VRIRWIDVVVWTVLGLAGAAAILAGGLWLVSHS
jgi:hypothetical protein